MTSVYSGGLVFEYSEEAGNANFGLVNIVSPTSVTEKQDFTNLQAQLAANPAPAGNGGYKSSLPPLACPTQDANWQAASTVPALPSAAAVYMTAGAGRGAGFTGAGSQSGGNAPAAGGASSVVVTTVTSSVRASSGTAAASTVVATSAAATASAAATSRAAASNMQVASLDKAPLMVGGLVAALMVAGAGFML